MPDQKDPNGGKRSPLTLPPEVCGNILWQYFHMSSFRDFVKLRTVCYTFARDIPRLILQHQPLHNIDWEDPQFTARLSGWNKIKVLEMPAHLQAEYLFIRVMNKHLHPRSYLINMVEAVSRRLQAIIKAEDKHKSHARLEYQDIVRQVIACCVSNPLRPDNRDFWGTTAHIYFAKRLVPPLPEDDVEHAVAVCAAYIGLERHVIDVLNRDEAWKEGYSDREAPIFGNPLGAAVRGGQGGVVQSILYRQEPLSCIWRCTTRAEAIQTEHWGIFEMLSKPVNHDKCIPLSGHLTWRETYGHELDANLEAATKIGSLSTIESLVTAADSKGIAHHRYMSKILYGAARHGRTDIAQFAISHGADIHFNADGPRHLNYRLMPLLIAADYGHHEVVELLVKAGAVGDGNDWSRETAHCTALEDQPLYQAAFHGHVRAVEKLLDAGVNIDMYDYKNHLRFTWMYGAAENGETEVMRLLLRRGFDLTAGQGRAGTTAAKGAAKHGYISAVKILVEAGVKPNTVAECAKKWGQWNVYEMLMEMMGKCKKRVKGLGDETGRRSKRARR